MNAKRLYFGLVTLIALLGLGFIFAAYEANTILENQSSALVNAKAKSQGAADRQALLAQDKKDIQKYAELNTIAKSVVPQDKDQAEAVNEIVNLAAQSGIPQLSSITFPPSTLGGTQVKTSAGLTQVTPVKGVSGVYNLQITITQSNNALVPYSSFITFLAKLEQNRRTTQVSSIDVEPDAKNPNLTAFTLVVNEFIKP